MITVSSSSDIDATQVSEYDSSLDDPSVLFVDGIGPIAQYHNYVDVAEEKGLHLFARDYRNWQNSKCKVEKMPPKNSYGKQRASWADIDDDARLDELANREAQRLEREASTNYDVPKTKFVSRGSNQVKTATITVLETRNAFDSLRELTHELLPERPRVREEKCAVEQQEGGAPSAQQPPSACLLYTSPSPRD